MSIELLKRILNYLYHTTQLGLTFKGDEIRVFGYADSDFAGDITTRKSTSGYVIYIGSSPVGWHSKLQSIVAQSTAEAEYVSACLAANFMVWLKSFLYHLGFADNAPEIPAVLYEDNKACVDMARKNGISALTKHIDIRYHVLKGYIASGAIVFAKIPTAFNTADAFTKALDDTKFKKHRPNMLGGFEYHWKSTDESTG
jgi:hypothetical protein